MRVLLLFIALIMGATTADAQIRTCWYYSSGEYRGQDWNLVGITLPPAPANYLAGLTRRAADDPPPYPEAWEWAYTTQIDENCPVRVIEGLNGAIAIERLME